MALSEKAIEVVRGARALIPTQEHWSHKGMGTARRFWDEGCRCTLVALQHAHLRGHIPIWAFQEAREAAYVLLGGGTTIGEWNDAPGRTHADVMDLFDKMEEDTKCQSTTSPARSLSPSSP